MTSLHSTIWEIPQELLNDNFTNVIIQKLIKAKFA